MADIARTVLRRHTYGRGERNSRWNGRIASWDFSMILAALKEHPIDAGLKVFY